MKAIFKKDDLLRCLKISGIPIGAQRLVFTNYRMEMKYGKSCITGVNSTIGIRTFLSGDVDEEFVCIVPKLILDVIKLMPGEDITLERKKNQLLIRSEKTKFSIECCNDVFYEIIRSAYDEPESIQIDIPDFSKAINECFHSLGNKDSMNDLFESFYVQFNEDSSFSICATDGKRISERGNFSTTDFESGFLLPGNSICEIIKYLPDTCTLKKKKDIITFIGEDIIVDMIQPEGKYFNLSNIFKQNFTMHISVDRKEIISKLKLVNLLSNGVCLNIKENILLIQSADQNNEIQASIECDLSGEMKELSIKLSSKYFSETLASIEDDIISMDFTAPKAPVFLTSEKYREVILPIATR